MSSLITYVLGLRPWFWWAAIAPGIAGYLWTTDGVAVTSILSIIFVLGFGIAGFAEMANEVFDNQYDEYQRQFSVLSINSSGNTGVYRKENWVAQNCVSVMWLHLALTVVIGLVLSVPLFLLLAGLFLGFGYSAKPLRFKARAWSNIMSKILGYGLVAFSIGVSFGDISYDVGIAAAIGLSLGLLQCSFNGIADVNDIETDRLNGILTLPVSVGATKAAVVFMVFSVLGLSILLAYKALAEAGALSTTTILIGFGIIVSCAILMVNFVCNSEKIEPCYAQQRSRHHLLAGVLMMSSALWLVN